MPTILIKKSDTASAVPGTANLTNLAGGAEVAVNTADRRMFTMNSSSAVVELGTNPSSLTCADGSFTLLKAASASITNLTATSLVLSNLSIASANVTTLTSASATITNLLATSLTVSSGSTLNGGVVINEPGADVDFRVESDTDANCLFVDASANNVGIGTSSPGAKLHVEASSASEIDIARFRVLNGASGVFLDIGGDEPNRLITFDATGAGSCSYVFRSGGTERMRLDSSGNLGIGTTSPSSFAGYTTVSVNNATNGGIYNILVNGTETARLQAFSGAFNVAAKGASTNLLFETNGSERARIDTSGNLGIGVTPSAWSSGKAVEVGFAGRGLWGFTQAVGYETTNAYYNAGFKYGGTGAATAYAQDTGAHIWYTAPSGTAGNAITFTQAMTLDANRRLQLNTTTFVGNEQFIIGFDSSGSFTQALNTRDTNASANGNSHIVLRRSDDTYLGSLGRAGTDTAMFVDGNSYLALRTGGTERARITSGGYFKASNAGTYNDVSANYHELRSSSNNSVAAYISSTATSGTQYGLYIKTANDQNDAIRYFLSADGGGVERATIRSNGGLANYSANNVNLASDERLKKDISPLATAWNKVKGMEVVNFRYKDCNEGDPLLYGVIAQQVQPIVPELVVVTREATETDPEYYGIREQPMYWLAIKALQEAMTKIETLEAKVAALEAK